MSQCSKCGARGLNYGHMYGDLCEECFDHPAPQAPDTRIERERAKSVKFKMQHDHRAERIEQLEALLTKARDALIGSQGNINPERSFAEGLEANIDEAIAAVDAHFAADLAAVQSSAVTDSAAVENDRALRAFTDSTPLATVQALRELHEAIEEVKVAFTALDGRKAWERVDAASSRASALLAQLKEQPAPADSAMEANAKRYEFLRARLLGADFDWNESGTYALVFRWPENVPVSADCDDNIDRALIAASKETR